MLLVLFLCKKSNRQSQRLDLEADIDATNMAVGTYCWYGTQLSSVLDETTVGIVSLADI